jgi:4-hydroxy-2-oxoheptanedioate aldolase
MTESRVLKKLRTGDFVRMICIGRVTEPWLTEVAGKLSFDLVWLDMEHRPFGYDVIAPIAMACRATGMDLMVRVLKTDYASPMRTLESGANGIMVPHCCSAEEARQWVDWVRFPPVGRRGFDGAGADADYALANPLPYLKHANNETFLALQIEDSDAVERVGEIAAVEGADILFVGPADLSISLGIPMQFEHPLMRRAVDRVAAAAAKSGKWWGTICPTPQGVQESLDKGARLVFCGSDHMFLVRGLQDASAEYRELRIR